jgi:hypothetical protein
METMTDERSSSREVAALSAQMQATALRLQEVTGNLQSYLYEQGHIKEDVTEVRRVVQSLNQLLREGDPSLVTRMHMVERELESLKDAQTRARDWWLKVLATVAGAAIITMIGVVLTLYMGTKGGVVKP